VRCWPLALLILLVAAPAAPAHDARQAIDECLRKLDPAADVGYARVVALCPDLPAALSATAAWLPTDWNRPDNQLSAAGLTELRVLLAQPAPTAKRALPRIAGVAGLLAELAQSERAHSSWWSRCKQWLRHLLAPPPQSVADDNWLRRWLRGLELSSGTAELIAWSALALVVAFALGIIFNELRIAGVARRGGRGVHRGPGGVVPAAGHPGPGQIDCAAPAEQPRLLLEFIAWRLVEQHRLPPARALTAGELTRRAQLPVEERAQLAELATVCERVRFAGGEVPRATLASAVATGRRLLAALDRATAQPGHSA
jgi:hypothetical protein